MSIVSLFSGAGGLELGLERAGFGETLAQVEIDPYCRRVLRRHWPGAMLLEDVRAAGAHNLPRARTLCGGFPCTDVSVAGERAGLEGEESGLWREFHRIAGELRPPRIVVENVSSGARNWLPHVRRDLHLLGYRTRALLLSAFECGAPHHRRRVFVLAADPDRVPIRDIEQWGPGRRARQVSAPGQALAPPDGDPRPAPWRWRRAGRAWTFESGVPGALDGVPHGVERRRLMGNACSPIQAEVAGRFFLAVTGPVNPG